MMFSGFLLSLIFTHSLGARILGIVPTASYSHQIVFQPLWKELSLRGHQLTVLTTDPQNNPSLTNLTEINLNASYELWNKINMVDMADAGLLKWFTDGVELWRQLFNGQLQHPEVQALIKDKNAHFDLLIVEDLFIYMYAFGARFYCPLIAVSSLDAPSYVYQAIGNPSHPVLNPDFMLPFAGKLTFLQRLISSLFNLFIQCYNNIFMFPAQQLLIETNFGEGYPPLQDIMRNTSMLFVNIDPIFHPIRPVVPAVVLIGGGTHLKPVKPLPKDLQRYIDGAPQGVIYFSLGTNVKSKQLPEDIRGVILETFAELPYLVLWKFELEDLPGKPDNVVISKWFPQQDILRHPNIKLFITQGGLQSTEESIYSNVPMVGIPFIGDQVANIERMVSKGLGSSLDYRTLEKDTFKKTILEVISNPKYRNTVKKLAQLAKDEPMTGLERAIWWTEYVLRHKGAKHLRSPAIDLPAYQYFLLDVIAAVLFVASVATFVLILVTKFSFKLIRSLFLKRKIKQQ